MARIILALLFLGLGTVGAWAQGCGPQNPNCVVPDRPLGDSSNSAANTRFVQLSGGGGGGGGTASNFGAAFPTAGTAAGAKNGGLMVPFNTDASGNLLVNVAVGGGTGGTSSTYGATFPTVGTAIGLQSGANMIAWPAKAANTVANTDVVAEVAVANATALGRQLSSASSPVVPSAASTHFHLIATGTSADAQQVKGSAATLLSCQLGNNSATIAYLKIYNLTGTPTTATVPYKTIIIPGPSAGGGGNNPNFGPGGIALGTGFGIAVTTTIADNTNTGVAAASVVVDCDYE